MHFDNPLQKMAKEWVEQQPAFSNATKDKKDKAIGIFNIFAETVSKRPADREEIQDDLIAVLNKEGFESVASKEGFDESVASSVDQFFKYNFPSAFDDLVKAFSKKYKDIIDFDLQNPPTQVSQQLIDIEKLGNGKYVENLFFLAKKAFGTRLSEEFFYNDMMQLLNIAANGTTNQERTVTLKSVLSEFEELALPVEDKNGILCKKTEESREFLEAFIQLFKQLKDSRTALQQEYRLEVAREKEKQEDNQSKILAERWLNVLPFTALKDPQKALDEIASVFKRTLLNYGNSNSGEIALISKDAAKEIAKTECLKLKENEIERYLISFVTFENASQQEDIFSSFIKCCHVIIEDDIKNPPQKNQGDLLIIPWDIDQSYVVDPLIEGLEIDPLAVQPPDLKDILKDLIYDMYSFAANGKLNDTTPFSIGIGLIKEKLPPCNPEKLKILLHTVLNNYMKIKSGRAYYLIEQKAQAERLLKSLANISASEFYESWSISPFFPQEALIGEIDKEKILMIFSEMSYDLEKNIPLDREKFFENIAEKAAKVIFKEEIIPDTFVSNLKAYLFFSFTNEPTQFSYYVQKLFSKMIEEDKKPFSQALGDPLLDFASLEGGRLLASLKSTLQGSTIPLSDGVQLFNRLLNGSKSGTVTLESFIKTVLASPPLLDVSPKFLILNELASLYSYLNLNRSLIMEQHKREISFYVENISKQREELLNKFQLVINDEKEDKFKNASKVEFKDFEIIERGKYLGNTLKYIKEYSTDPVYQRHLTNLVMIAYERAANGKVRPDSSSPLEDLILETSRLPLPTTNFPFYEDLNNKLLNEFVNCYLMIKRDRTLIPELRKRANAFQGMQKRMITVLNRIERYPEASQPARTPRWVKINSFAHRYLARVAPTVDSMSEQAMLGHSTHQPASDYFRASIVPGQSNRIMDMAKGKLLRELDVGQEVAFDEIYLLNTAEIEKPLQSSFRYRDVTQISEEGFRREFEELLLQIDESGAEAQAYMLGFKMRPKPDVPTNSIGIALTDKIYEMRRILIEEIERHATKIVSQKFARTHTEIAPQDYKSHRDFKSFLKEEIGKYLSLISLVGIVDNPTTPFLVIPRIDPFNLDESKIIQDIHLKRILNPVIERGFTPTMQKTIEYISTNAPFFNPIAGEVGEAGSLPDPSLQVDSIKALREHQIFKAFKALSSSDKAREAEVTFIMHNTMKLIESIDEQQEKALVERFTKEGDLSLLRDSFALVLSSMRDVLDFEFGLLPRDTADMVRVKEHVMEQVFMWLDNPLPQPKTEAEEIANRQILLQKRDTLERYMDRAHFETLGPPDFSQFVAGGGMNALTTVLKGYVELKNGLLNVGEYDDSYYKNAHVFKSMETNKIQQKFTIKSLDDEKSLDEMISQLQKNQAEIRKCEEDVKTALEALRKVNVRLSQDGSAENSEASLQASDDVQTAQNKLKEAQSAPTEIDILFVDPHPSPTETHHVIKANNIERIIQRMMGSGVISPLFTVAMDTTNLTLNSREFNDMISKITTAYGSKLDIVTYKSCQKFDSLGSDKLSGGYVAIFSKRKEVIETFHKFKKEDPIDRFNVEGFTHIFKNFPKEIAHYQKLILSNTALCYQGINPNFIFDPKLLVNKRVYFDRSEDRETYFNSLNFPNTLEIAHLYSRLHNVALIENWILLLRFSYGFEISTIDNIGTMKIRIKNGIESKQSIMQFSKILNKFYREVSKAVGEDPGPLDLRYEDAV